MSFISKLFGSNVKPAQIAPYIPPTINAGGLSSTPGANGSYTVNPTDSRNLAVGGISNSYNTLGNLTGDLRSTVTPGFNQILEAQLNDINSNAHRAIGDLSQNLASRRILGSSFGQDTLSRAQAEYAKQRADVIGNNYLSALDASNKLLQQQYSAYVNSFNTKLTELNLESGLATDLSTKASSIINDNAKAQAGLNQQAAVQNANTNAGIASGLGRLIGSVALAPFTGGTSLLANAGSLFSGGGLTNVGGLGVPGAFTSQAAMGGGYGGGVFG